MAKYFVGIEPEQPARSRLGTPNAHVTLLYLGDSIKPDTIKKLKEIAHRNRDFNIEYNNLKPDVKGYGPASNLRRTGRLMRLQQDIHKNLGNSEPGYYDKTLYSPHITISHKTGTIPAGSLKERVDKIYLYKDSKKIKGFKLRDRNKFQVLKDRYFGDIEKTSMIRKEQDGRYHVYSEKGSPFGTYNTESEAKRRLAMMEYFKHKKK